MTLLSRSVARNVVGLALLLGVWQLLSSLGVLNALLMPSPARIAGAAFDLARQGVLLDHTIASLVRVLTGFLMAAVAGVALGVILGLSQVLADLFRPIVETLRPIPPIAWTPIAILWFGIGDAPSYFLVFIGAIFPIFINTFSAVRSIDRRHVHAALCLGASRSLVLRDVVVPSALPLIFPGLRIGLGVGWMCVVAAELIAAQSGLGYMIQQSRMLLQTQNVVTGMLTIGIVGFLMSALMTWIERRLIPWRIT